MTVRIALAGAGWSGTVHTLAASVVPGVSIPLVATRSVGSAEVLASQIGARPVTADALPGSAQAVVVATPAAAHAELAVRLLAAGTPVLVESPLATTLVDADAIVDAAEASGTAACYAENLLFAPAVDVAVSRRGALGTLDHLDVRLSAPTPEHGHHAEAATAGGVLLDLGPHAVALAMVLAGDDAPAGVRARLASARDDGADDVARVELRFASDLIVPIDLAWGAETVEWGAQAASPAGTVRLDLQPQASVEVDGTAVALPAPHADVDARVSDLGYRSQMEGFAGVVGRTGGRVCPVGFGRTVLEVLCAAAASAGRGGDEVTLPFEGPRDRTPLQLWHAV